MCSTIFYTLIAVIGLASCLPASSHEWDATIRDKSEFCNTMAQYSPTADIYCQQFDICCSSQFDPNNGDRCQLKESECVPDDAGNTGTGTCRLLNCTELITTTTTTTTTPPPQFESVNAAVDVLSFLSIIATIMMAVV